MSVPMTIARPGIHHVFDDLKNLDLVLGVKNTVHGMRDTEGPRDLSSVNAHGRFSLVLQDWGATGRETLVAYVLPGHLAPTGEPSVHVHVDWNSARFLRVEDFRLPLIGTDVRIAFVTDSPGGDVLLGFYARKDTPTFQRFIKNWQMGDSLLP